MKIQELFVLRPENFAVQAARLVASAIGRALTNSTDGSVSVCLCGGSTPRAVYGHWATASGFPWEDVEVFFGDERCVAPDDPESNYALVREMLLDPLGEEGPRVYRMHGEEPDADAAARAYEEHLPAAFDVLLLGMGEDGHTASLFPGGKALAETKRRVVSVVAPKAPPRRLTITPAVVLAAQRTFVLVTGSGKADRLHSVLETQGTVEEEPIRLAEEATWILDEAAAAELVSARPPEEDRCQE